MGRRRAVNHSPKLDDDMMAGARFRVRRFACSRASSPRRTPFHRSPVLSGFLGADYPVIHLTHSPLSPRTNGRTDRLGRTASFTLATTLTEAELLR